MVLEFKVIKAHNPDNFTEPVYVYVALNPQTKEVINFTFHNLPNDWITLEVIDNINYYNSFIDLENKKAMMVLENGKKYELEIIEEIPEKEFKEDYPYFSKDFDFFIKDTLKYSII